MKAYQNTPAQNAWAALLTFLGALVSISLACDGWPGYGLLLGSLTVLLGLCVEWGRFLPESEQGCYDVLETHPQLTSPHRVSTVPDHMLAWDEDGYDLVDLYHCLGTNEAYTGLDCFGNLVSVEDDGIVGRLSPEDQAGTVGRTPSGDVHSTEFATTETPLEDLLVASWSDLSESEQLQVRRYENEQFNRQNPRSESEKALLREHNLGENPCCPHCAEALLSYEAAGRRFRGQEEEPCDTCKELAAGDDW